MKKFLVLVLALMGLATICFADVTSEIVSVDKDENGNIRVWSQYKVDGVEVTSKYPKINDKSVYCVRYDALNFANMTDEQMIARIKEDNSAHAKNLIQKKYILSENDNLIKNKLNNLAGTKITETEVLLKLDTDKDGESDKEYTITTAGITATKSIAE